MRKPSSPSVHFTRSRISSLRKVNLESAPFEFIKKRITPLIVGYTIQSPIIPLGQNLFRGIKYSVKPINLRELSYPPAQIAVTFQRANRPGQPMFYGSTAREAPFFELGARRGKHLVISRWRANDLLLVNNAGYSKSVFNALNNNRSELPEWARQNNINSNPTNRIVHDFFQMGLRAMFSLGGSTNTNFRPRSRKNC